MFRKSESSIIDFQKGKSFDNYQVKKDIIVKNNYHGTKAPLAKVTAKWDKSTFEHVKNTQFKGLLDLSNDNIKKEEDTEATINNALQNTLNIEIKAKKAFVLSKKAFKKALEHHCFYETTEIQEGIFKITFVPFSTSNNSVLCGIQEFDKIPLLLNTKYKNFYTIRVLFSKTMTKEELIAWEADQKNWYQDMKLRRYLFNVIQKDLDNNDYSILSEEDLLNPKVEFFTKELPRVKFKFTDLVE